MAITNITVTGTWLEEDGVTPAQGYVMFLLSAEIKDSSTNAIRVPQVIRAYLDQNGHISQKLAANDDPTTLPTGTTYTVTENITGAPPRVTTITVPHGAAGGTIDLSTTA